MHNNRKQLLERRALRSRKAWGVGPYSFFVFIVGFIGFVWLLALLVLKFFESAPINDIDRLELVGEPLDLWPNDRQSRALLEVIVSCIPENASDEICQQRRLPGSSTQQVGLIHSGGALGMIMQKNVEQLVESHPIDKDRVELISSSHLKSDHQYTKVIRFAVLPMLLEAVDLALGTTDPSFTKEQLTLGDIEGIIRLLLRWHCRISMVARSTALLTLSAKRSFARPVDTAKRVGMFLGFLIGKKEDLMSGDAVDARSSAAIQRIDECSRFVAELQKLQDSRSLFEWADDIVNEELAGGRCKTDEDGGFGLTRSTKIVRHMLGPETYSVCEEYPKIALCKNIFADLNESSK